MRNTTLFVNAPKTFRRASRKLFGVGGNLQNVEESLRSIYIPDGFTEELKSKCLYWIKTGDLSIFSEEEIAKINVFVQCDQSGAEALIVAYLCRAGDYRKLFENSIKPHVYVAMKLFKDVWNKEIKERGGIEVDIDLLDITPIDKLRLNPDWKTLDAIIRESDSWPTSKRYYYFGKQTAHSGNYGIECATFIMNVLEKSGGKVVIPKLEGQRFLMTYRGLFPEIPEWNGQTVDIAIKHKILYNLHGFPYIITDENILPTRYKELIAWVPQSTVAEITRIAYTNLQEYIESNNRKWDLLLDGHDSILTQGPLTDVKERITKMQQCINQELESPVDGTKFRMKSEAQVGFNWSKKKRDSNELGLREISW